MIATKTHAPMGNHYDGNGHTCHLEVLKVYNGASKMTLKYNRIFR